MSENVLMYFGHHKCASSWVRLLIKARLSRHSGRSMETFDHVHQFNGQLGVCVEERGLDFVAYTNAKIEYVRGAVL